MGISQTDFLRMAARSRKPTTLGQVFEKESSLQNQIVDWCRAQSPPWLAWRGSMAHRTFRTPGEPDFFIQAPGGRWFAVECKTKTGKLTMEQKSVEIQMAELGHKLHVVRSLAEFVGVVGAQPKLPNL